jgi:hypothetical protein
MIDGSLSSCIAGFHQSCRFSQSFGPRRSCVGTGPAFAATGVGNRVDGEGGHSNLTLVSGETDPDVRVREENVEMRLFSEGRQGQVARVRDRERYFQVNQLGALRGQVLLSFTFSEAPKLRIIRFMLLTPSGKTVQVYSSASKLGRMKRRLRSARRGKRRSR